MIKMAVNMKFLLRPTNKQVEDNALEVSKTRLYVIAFVALFCYLVLVIRLFELSFSSKEDIKITSRAPGTDFFVQRADVLDRNGLVLATNLATASLYANPQKIIDPQASVDLLCGAFEELDCEDLLAKINDKSKSFAWIIRHLSPKQQQIVHDLAIPGMYFVREEKRVYPHGPLFSHMLGFVDLDGNGIAGIERYYNERLGTENTRSLVLSVDARVQQIVKEELKKQIDLHNAIGGSGLVMDVNTGEIISLVSLPDFDPNNPGAGDPNALFNQITLGAYEMGSTFKVLTLAMGLEGNYINVNDAFDTDQEIKIGTHKISDYRGKGGMLSVPEILMYSSNVGTAQIAMKAGVKEQRKFLQQFGMLSAPDIEIHEKTRPLFPTDANWNQSSLITISYGHGMAVTPLQSASAFAAVVNGGKFVKSTLVKIDEPSEVKQKNLISPKTSATMKKLLRLATVYGSAKKANAEGLLVGGKTGTAEKVINGRYSKSANLASFIGAFPMNDPRYVVLVMIDEAKRNQVNHGFTTGGMIAAPVAGEIISQISPILNVAPLDEDDPEVLEALEINFQPRYKPLTYSKPR